MSYAMVAAAVVGAASSYNNGKQQQKAAANAAKAQQPLTDLITQNARTTQPYVGQFYQRAQQGFDPAFQHYRDLASNNRATVMGAVAPGAADIATKYQQLIQSTGALGGARGTGRSAAFNAELPFRAGDDVQSLIAGERATAYPNLSAMAGQAASIGGSAAGQSNAAGYGASNLITGAYNMQRQNAGDQANNQQQIAQNLLDAYKAYGSGNGKGGAQTLPVNQYTNYGNLKPG